MRKILKEHYLWLKKSLGQHFLIDQNIIEKIIGVANLKKGDIVLEIGAGIGVLTTKLSQKVKKVIAVEIDKKMVEILKERLKGVENVEIVNKDVLEIEKLNLKNYKIVANIPYQITSPILEKFLKTSIPKPYLVVLLIQKEVAQKICSKPPKMNRLAILVQFYGNPQINAFVSRNCFWPKPKVESAILQIKDIGEKNWGLKFREKDFFLLVKIGFSHPRKQLCNNLARGFGISLKLSKELLKKAHLDWRARAETLAIDDWLRLGKVVFG